MSYETVLLPKWLSHQGIILANSFITHTFWAMPILIFNPVYLFMRHPLPNAFLLKLLFFLIIWPTRIILLVLRSEISVGQYQVVESLTNVDPRPFYRGIKMLSRFLLDLHTYLFLKSWLRRCINLVGLFYALIFKSTNL